ncbi:AAA family ATPase [Methylobacterium sp. NFXW15]|uniref:AAA family ATPase n=1 Tax=Methylobacterium sp. NFXW15 TaxID=2819512 RepID=UPI003CEB66C7
MARVKPSSRLDPPYLRRVWLDRNRVLATEEYPFCLPLFRDPEFELTFERPLAIFTGENGVGKSTLLEGIAGLAGFDEAGGGKGYRAVDHSRAIEAMGSRLSDGLRASWLPKITDGWFFRSESFFSVARYLDAAATEVGAAPPDFLSHSHGEGFLRFFEERCQRRGLFIFDEPEAALSPSRQIDFLKIVLRMIEQGKAQVIMATHSPLLMACPGAQLMAVGKYSVSPTSLGEIGHFRLLREFYSDPDCFMQAMLSE